jgi:hypothetical protein
MNKENKASVAILHTRKTAVQTLSCSVLWIRRDEMYIDNSDLITVKANLYIYDWTVTAVSDRGVRKSPRGRRESPTANSHGSTDPLF